MKIGRGFLKVYPELALLPDDEERVRVFKQVQRRVARGMLRRPLFWLACIGFGVFNTAMVGALSGLVLPWFPAGVPGWLGRMILAAILGAGFGLFFHYIYRKPVQQLIREQLVARGIPVCIPCGYDLRGQIEPRCPECGAPFDSRLLTPQAPNPAPSD